MTDPWEDFDLGDEFAGDHIYAGEHEIIKDLVLLTEVVLAFEHWADDFRYWDRHESQIPMSRWEEDSPFSEATSIQVSMAAEGQQ